MDTANTYTWRTAGQTNQFVKLVDFRGHDIVCTLATLRLIETWPEGADLVWQVVAALAIATMALAGCASSPQQALEKFSTIDSPIELGRAIAVEQSKSADTGFGLLDIA